MAKITPKEFIRAVLVAAAVILGAPLIVGILPEALKISLGGIDLALLLVAGAVVIAAQMVLAKVPQLK